MRGKLDLDQQPLVLIWEVTQACELACKHCRADAQPRRHPDELSTAEGKALLDQAREFGDGQLVVLSGGDPLARADLPELVDYGTEQGLRMTLTPSGTNSITQDRLAELDDAGLRRLALSIDGGDSESHDAFRGEAGSFEATMEAAEAARDLDIPLQINTTVCAETVEQLPAIRDLVAELDAVLWSVFFLVPVGRGRVLTPIDPERAERVLSWLHEVSEEAPFGLKTTEAPHYRRVAMQNQNEGAGGLKRRMGIRAGKGFAFVSHTGEVYPSGFLPKSAGNVREDSVVDIYRDSTLFQQLRDDDALTGKCGACRYRTVCGGSRSRAYATTGDPLAADPLCDYQPDGFEGTVPDQHPAD
ncbi:radical SAM/SPASM domain-containing protein [Haloarcula sp. CBA1130]|uniref:radical SAM/SPASM domain-containing protein n=1 Tax=unclassified Haloarcula TaxID=2624677 RepID=UPI001245CFB5|nr:MULTISPECIES: radical SAM/SPASM domain-containing protein [unclassified Haloarcula]KAA9398787.1 radical SAM/SPASM domain-containing protein [Haloarcula sp. CBA1129]KAA9403302.1 radical SAM/SPASM domain-containing protein [Haloarcula sp. CBA1130]